MRHLRTTLLGGLLALAVATPALAELPTSPFGGTYLMSSANGDFVAYQMADGRVRWEFAGVPMSDWGVDNVAMASSIGFGDPSLLVRGGQVRGFYVASSSDGSWMAFAMPDGAIRWEHNGVPATPE